MGKKPDAKLVSLLQSGDEKHILHTIHHLRSPGNPDYLPYIMPLLLQPVGIPVRKAVLELLSDLKSQKAVPRLIGAIADPEYLNIRKDLITCCWQCGLDFSDHLPFFVDLVVENEFDIAFEAFTVIDSMEYFLSEEVHKILIAKIEEAIPAFVGAKKSLLQELYVLLK
jgi:hypothetical protein